MSLSPPRQLAPIRPKAPGQVRDENGSRSRCPLSARQTGPRLLTSSVSRVNTRPPAPGTGSSLLRKSYTAGSPMITGVTEAVRSPQSGPKPLRKRELIDFRSGRSASALDEAARSVPLLMESVDSVQLQRPIRSGNKTPGQSLLIAMQVSSSKRRQENGGNNATAPIRHMPSLTSPISNDLERLAEAEGAATAAARYSECQKRRRYSPGDRLAYTAERVDFHAHRPGLAYYAICPTGVENEVFIHGGQLTPSPEIVAEAASSACYKWSVSSSERSAASLTAPTESFNLPPLVGHSMVCYRGSRLFIYGGVGPYVSGLFSDLIAVNLATGESGAVVSSTPQPGGRARHACCSVGHHMYIHGGHSLHSKKRLLADLWKLDMRDATWERLPSTRVNVKSLDKPDWLLEADWTPMERPGARCGHHITTFDDWLYLAFGVDGGPNGLTDIWAYHLEDHYWNRVHPREKISEPRVDCASAVLGRKWLFHGGIDLSSGVMVNSFYEFDFVTHEGRQMRVELAMKPPKILPALMGHAMLGLDSRKLFIFGGINRQGTVVHLVYSMTDSGQAPGIVCEPAIMPPPPPPESGLEPLLESSVAQMNESPRSSISGDARRLLPESIPPSPMLIPTPVSSAPPPPPPAIAADPTIRKHLEEATALELEELRKENESLRRELAAMETRPVEPQLCENVLELIVRTEEAFQQIKDLSKEWAELYRTTMLSMKSSGGGGGGGGGSPSTTAS